MFGKSKKYPINPDQLEISTIIGEDCEFLGTIKSKNSVRIEGKVVGDVSVQKGIVLGEHGSISGNIVAESSIIFGKVDGNVTAKHLEIKSTGFINGDVKTDFLQIEMGGLYNGKLEMKNLNDSMKLKSEPIDGKENGWFKL